MSRTYFARNFCVTITSSVFDCDTKFYELCSDSYCEDLSKESLLLLCSYIYQYSACEELFTIVCGKSDLVDLFVFTSYFFYAIVSVVRI